LLWPLNSEYGGCEMTTIALYRLLFDNTKEVAMCLHSRSSCDTIARPPLLLQPWLSSACQLAHVHVVLTFRCRPSHQVILSQSCPCSKRDLCHHIMMFICNSRLSLYRPTAGAHRHTQPADCYHEIANSMIPMVVTFSNGPCALYCRSAAACHHMQPADRGSNSWFG
jgi:hypothetical protein